MALQAWLGHKRIDETTLYVHVAEAHHRELAEIVRAKSPEVDDSDQRVLAMLGARVDVTEVRGSGVAVTATSATESFTKFAACGVRAGDSLPAKQRREAMLRDRECRRAARSEAECERGDSLPAKQRR